MNTVLITLGVSFGLAFILGVLLGFFKKFFHVPVDPTVERVREVLPSAKMAEFNDGTVDVVPAEDCVNLLLTIQGEGIVSEGRCLLNRIYDLGVNSSRNFYTKYAQFTGTVTNIQVP